MARRALLFGIDKYKDFSPLACASNDAYAMRDLLCRHDNGEPNYHCRVVCDAERTAEPITNRRIQENIDQLFEMSGDELLLFFAGHGVHTSMGAYICGSDSTNHSPGIPMNNILVKANKSGAREVLIILDCCYSGAVGDSLYNNGHVEQLREGVTLLAATRPSQLAAERLGQGVFTGLLLDALRGGAADIRGSVTAADLYAYVAQALDAWEQRPLYKSYTSEFSTVRKCAPLVSDLTLRALLDLFSRDDSNLELDESYEETSERADPANVAKFFKLKELRNAGLVFPVDHPDLYWAAVRKGRVTLTVRGKRYWRMANKQLI